MFTYVYYSDFKFNTQIRSVVKQHISFYISAIYFSLCYLLLTFILMFTPGLFVSTLCCHNYHMLTRLEVQQISQYTTVIVVVISIHASPNFFITHWPGLQKIIFMFNLSNIVLVILYNNLLLAFVEYKTKSFKNNCILNRNHNIGKK